MNLTVYICKSCGRAMRATVPPTYCYADRMDTIENLSNEDAAKMGLFSFKDGVVVEGTNLVVEFPGDMRWNPFTGRPMAAQQQGTKLTDLQTHIMEQVTKC